MKGGVFFYLNSNSYQQSNTCLQRLLHFRSVAGHFDGRIAFPIYLFFFFSKWSRTCLALKVNWVNQELHKTFYSIRVIKNCLTEKTSTQFQSLSCERKNMHPSQSNIKILSNSSNKWLQHKLKMCCGLLIFFFFFSFISGWKISSCSSKMKAVI